MSLGFNDSLERTCAPPIQPQALPDLPDYPAIVELKLRPQWVAWRYEDRGGPKPTKPPINPHTGGYAKSDDPSTWGTYDQAIERARRDDLAGVGFMLSEDDNYSGYDLDKCRNPKTGRIKPWAQELLRHGETYAEISPSESGIRLIARGKISKAIKCDTAKVEVYGRRRYLTITGNKLADAPDSINPAVKTGVACQERAELHSRTWAALAEAAKPREVNAKTQAAGTATRKRGVLWRAMFGDGDPFFRSVSSKALERLSDWVPALFGSAAKAGNLGYRVSSADLGRDLQEDLSITSAGIVDFGVHDIGDANLGKRTPIDVVLEYGTAGTAVVDAALWLCEQMGIAPATLGWRGGGKQKTPSRMFYFDDCATVTAKLWLLKGLIARGECSSWIAPPGKGKSGLLTAIAIHVAAGKDFGRFRSKGPCGVLYLALERAAHTKRRMTAYAQKGFKALPVAVRPGIINLMDPACIDIIVAAIREAEQRLGVKIGLVIIDTFAKGIAAGGGDENHAKDQGRCLAHLQDVRDQTGCHTAIIHHTGKDVTRGARGSNSQVADVDVK